jgi:hypothetical protein
VRARAALGASGARVAPMARLAAAVQVMFTLCSSRLASPALAATFPPRFDTYTVATTGSVQRVYVRDVDGDGLVDIASASDATDVVAWYKNGGGLPWAHRGHTSSSRLTLGVTVWTVMGVSRCQYCTRAP